MKEKVVYIVRINTRDTKIQDTSERVAGYVGFHEDYETARGHAREIHDAINDDTLIVTTEPCLMHESKWEATEFCIARIEIMNDKKIIYKTVVGIFDSFVDATNCTGHNEPYSWTYNGQRTVFVFPMNRLSVLVPAGK